MHRKITHPLHPFDPKYPISSVLNDLAAQENCDGEPYDQMVEAADYIDELESIIHEQANIIPELEKTIIGLRMKEKRLTPKQKKKKECNCKRPTTVEYNHKKKKRKRNSGIVIKYETLPNNKINITKLKALRINQLPPAYKKQSKAYIVLDRQIIMSGCWSTIYDIADNNDKIILHINNKQYILLVKGKIYSKEVFYQRIKIIKRCGEILHQWNKNCKSGKIVI